MIMSYIYIFCALLAGLLPAEGVSQLSNPGPRFSGIARSGIALQDAWCIQGNPAGLAGISGGVAASAIVIGLPGSGLHTSAVLAALPVQKQVWATAVQVFGFEAYREWQLSAATARSFGESLSAGLKVVLGGLRVSGYGTSNTVAVEAGMQWRVTGRLALASQLIKPVSTGTGTPDPSGAGVGGSYMFPGQLRISVALYKWLRSAADLRAGLEYTPLPWASLRTGYATQGQIRTIGFGLVQKSLRIDVAVALHPVLGPETQLGLAYEL
jgi:hypothetical protein